jgi:hypothetical protein
MIWVMRRRGALRAPVEPDNHAKALRGVDRHRFAFEDEDAILVDYQDCH